MSCRFDPAAWPASRNETWPITRLKPYAHNPRTHTEAQVAQIAAAISEWGWTTPILVQPDGTIIAGHGRQRAAQRLGLPHVPVMIAEDWSDAQVRAYVIADNKLTENGGWDEDLLRLELGALGDMGFNLGLTGFSDEELAKLGALDVVGNTDPDDVPDVRQVPGVRLGDVWLLGDHRLVCGDCTDAGIVAAATLNDCDLMVTDPPYGVEYDPAWRNAAGISSTARVGKVSNDDRADWREAWALFPGDVAYVWHGALHATTVAESLMASGFAIRAQIVWAKDRLVLSRGHYHWQHEPCWYAVRERGKGHWMGDRKQSTLWTIAGRNEDADTIHGTQKPVECMKRPIENNSRPGDIVYDPFCGSGTTIIAAEMCGRLCHAIEIDPIYADVAIRRWEAFSGQSARHAETGETLAQRTPEKLAA